jgi:allantoicase
MADGWETARRRDDGNDWVMFRLAGAGVVRLAELDTMYFKGNAPGAASLSGFDATSGADQDDPAAWFEILPRTRLQPDTRHRFLLPPGGQATHARLDVYPDGGLSRVRLYGELTPPGREELGLRWLNTLPDPAALRALVAAGLTDEAAQAVVGGRPVGPADVPGSVRSVLLGRAG